MGGIEFSGSLTPLRTEWHVSCLCIPMCAQSCSEKCRTHCSHCRVCVGVHLLLFRSLVFAWFRGELLKLVVSWRLSAKPTPTRAHGGPEQCPSKQDTSEGQCKLRGFCGRRVGSPRLATPSKASAYRDLVRRPQAALMGFQAGTDLRISLWMDKFLHQIQTMENHCLLVFTRESSSHGFLGGAGLRPSTVMLVLVAL